MLPLEVEKISTLGDAPCNMEGGRWSHGVAQLGDLQYSANFFFLYAIKNVMLLKMRANLSAREFTSLILCCWPLSNSNTCNTGIAFELSFVYLGDKRLQIASPYSVGKHISAVQHRAKLLLA